MAKTPQIKARCRFGNLSIGDEKATIGVTCERNDVDVAKLESVVIGGRLDVKVTYDRQAKSDVDGQQKLADTSDNFRNVADCPSLQLKPTKVGFRLSFSRQNVPLEKLAGAAQAAGELEIIRIGDSGQDEDDA